MLEIRSRAASRARLRQAELESSGTSTRHRSRHRRRVEAAHCPCLLGIDARKHPCTNHPAISSYVARIPGINLCVREWGDRDDPIIVLLHGGGANAHWVEPPRAIARGYPPCRGTRLPRSRRFGPSRRAEGRRLQRRSRSASRKSRHSIRRPDRPLDGGPYRSRPCESVSGDARPGADRHFASRPRRARGGRARPRSRSAGPTPATSRPSRDIDSFPMPNTRPRHFATRSPTTRSAKNPTAASASSSIPSGSACLHERAPNLRMSPL